MPSYDFTFKGAVFVREDSGSMESMIKEVCLAQWLLCLLENAGASVEN